jgi:hypothetical protein
MDLRFLFPGTHTACKARELSTNYGTPEAVPFQDPGLKSETWATHSTFVPASIPRSTPFPTQIPLRIPENARGNPRYSLDGKSHDLTRAWQK